MLGYSIFTGYNLLPLHNVLTRHKIRMMEHVRRTGKRLFNVTNGYLRRGVASSVSKLVVSYKPRHTVQ